MWRRLVDVPPCRSRPVGASPSSSSRLRLHLLLFLQPLQDPRHHHHLRATRQLVVDVIAIVAQLEGLIGETPSPLCSVLLSQRRDRLSLWWLSWLPLTCFVLVFVTYTVLFNTVWCTSTTCQLIKKHSYLWNHWLKVSNKIFTYNRQKKQKRQDTIRDKKQKK